MRGGTVWEPVVRATDGRWFDDESPGEVVRLDLDVVEGVAANAPDGWVLLQNARAEAGDLAELQRRRARPRGAGARGRRQPVPRRPTRTTTGNPFTTKAIRAADRPPTARRGQRRTAARGVRRPAAAAPQRRPSSGRRPGRRHARHRLRRAPLVHRHGHRAHRRRRSTATRSATSTRRPTPRPGPTRSGPLDGGIDALAGHGTFIAGLIHQACPDADIVAWRVVASEGPIVESDLVKALERIAEVARRHRDGEQGGHPIDVLNLSMGYYHETPKDELFDPTMYEHPARSSASAASPWCCSAGNDATARPMFPAAFAPVARRRRPSVAVDPTPCRSSPWARSTPTAPTRCSATPAPGCAPTTQGASVMSTHAAVPGRPGAGGPHRGLPAASASRSTPTTTPASFARVERDVVRGAALRRPAGRAPWPRSTRPTTTGRADAVGRAAGTAVAAADGLTP